MMKKHLFLLKIVCIAAMLASLWMVYVHYAPSSAVCRWGSWLDCGAVNTSPYAHVQGVFYFLANDAGMDVPSFEGEMHPVLEFLTLNAFWGFVFFLAVFFCVFGIGKGSFLGLRRRQSRTLLLALMAFGLAYAGYLLWVALFVLRKICVFCVMLDLLLIVSFVLVYRLDITAL